VKSNKVCSIESSNAAKNVKRNKVCQIKGGDATKFLKNLKIFEKWAQNA